MEGTTRFFFNITNQNIDIYRNFSFDRKPKITVPDAKSDYKLIPNVSRNALTSEFQIIYTTNSLGLREKEIENTAKFKILFLGDSQTFGEGVPYGSRFSDLIEKEMDNVYSINAGVPGYSINNMYQYLKYHGLDLRPDLVICAIIPLDLNRAIYRKLESSPHLLIREANPSASTLGKMGDSPLWTGVSIRNALIRHSYFYAFIRARIKIWLLWRGLEERDKKEWEEIAQKGDGNWHKITTDSQKELVRETSFEIFREYKKLLQDAQIKFLVVNIGMEPIPWLEDHLRQENIDYFDISSVLKNTPNITFKIDVHYNTIGHRIITDHLKTYILEKYTSYISKNR